MVIMFLRQVGQRTCEGESAKGRTRKQLKGGGSSREEERKQDHRALAEMSSCELSRATPQWTWRELGRSITAGCFNDSGLLQMRGNRSRLRFNTNHTERSSTCSKLAASAWHIPQEQERHGRRTRSASPLHDCEIRRRDACR